MKSVSVIIPNFKGKDLLQENIPILLRETAPFKEAVEVIIVDDGSGDGSKEFISTLEGCSLIALEKNQGFAYAVNRGVEAAKGEIVYLLNADVKVCSGFLAPLLEVFSDESVFAASSLEIKEGQDSGEAPEVWVPLVKFKFGIFWYWYAKVKSWSHPVEVFCVSGGHSAYSRKKFLGLGGFDTLFRPFYAEDGDICWRAWKKGFKSLIVAQSRVIHKHKATIGRFYSDPRVLRIHWKNRFLMTWKVLTYKYLFFKHILFTLAGIFICPFVGKKEFSLGFFLALKQLPELARARRRDRVKNEIYSDRDLFIRFSRPAPYPPFIILYLHETSLIAGAENSLINLVKNLDPDDFKAVFVLPEPGPLSEELNKLGIETLFLPFPRARLGIGVWGTVRRLSRLVKTKEISLIHSNSIRTHFYATLAAKLNSIPVVWHQRNLLTTELIDPDRMFSFLADKIICNSQAITRRFARKEALPDKVSVVYNGVDTARFNPGVNGQKIREEFAIKPDDIVIGMASRFNRFKGHETFFQAAKEVLALCPQLRDKLKFLVAGGAVFLVDRQREQHLKNLVEKSGLGAKVIFSGLRRDMPEVYAAMDIAVLASTAEPCGRVILEAMASGKPLIATDSGGTPELVRDGLNGYLVKPGDHQALAEKIIFLLEHRELAQKIGQAARQSIEADFKIEKNAQKIQKIYLELLKKEHA